MNTKNLTKLEFEKIREMLATHAATQGAKELALTLMPSDDIDEVIKNQQRTEDAKRLSGQKGTPSFGSGYNRLLREIRQRSDTYHGRAAQLCGGFKMRPRTY